MRKYLIHQVTRKIVEENDLIAVETLKVKEMIERKENKKNHLSKNISNASFSEVIRQLEYKSKWNNKRLIKINTYFPSSKKCNRCGSINKEISDLSIRKWECENCGNENDRDINASINILEEGIRIYYKKILGN